MMINNLSILNYIQLILLLSGIVMLGIHKFKYILNKSNITQQIDIVNNIELPYKTITVDSRNTNINSQMKAIYLVKLPNLIPITEHHIFDTENRIYENYKVNNSEYVIIDPGTIELNDNNIIVLENNYTKSILIVKQSIEYFYLDVIEPSINKANIGFSEFGKAHMNKDKKQLRITRDELNDYKPLGKLIMTTSYV